MPVSVSGDESGGERKTVCPKDEKEVIHPFLVKDLMADATIGQYSGFLNISDFGFRCDCGQRATKMVPFPDPSPSGHFCDACHFRHTVMKAAGREQEFWDARKEQFSTGGWSYKVKYSTSVRPDTTMRLRSIKAGTENV